MVTTRSMTPIIPESGPSQTSETQRTGEETNINDGPLQDDTVQPESSYGEKPIPKTLPPQQINMSVKMLQALLQNLRAKPSYKVQKEYQDTKVPDPERFSSKSIKNFEEWIKDVENNIASRPRSYPDEASKIQYAAAQLDRDHRTQWREKKQFVDLQTFTFQDFRTQLKDQIKSPQNHGINAAVALMKLMQSIDQDLEAFYSRFSILYEKAREESTRIPPSEDVFKYRIFLAKLLPRIRSDITKIRTLPLKLSDLVTTAQRLYQIDKHKKGLENRPKNKNSFQGN